MSTVRCRITFQDGSDIHIGWNKREASNFNEGDLMRRALEQNNLVLEVDGKLLVIPYTNVRSIELNPAPAKLPDTVIRGAHLL